MPNPNEVTTTITKCLILFEKEKGGVGSTGTLVTIAHHLMAEQVPVVFVEASTSQRDIANAYSHHLVHVIDLTNETARVDLLEAVDSAPPGAAILVNVPGGRFHELYEVHQFVDFVVHQEQAIDVSVTLVWTMGLDAASRTTLDALLDSGPPGRVLLNLPAWHGAAAKFTNVDDELLERIEKTGGCVFVTPKMDDFLYDRFRSDEVALDRLADGATLGIRMAVRQWETRIANALKEVI